jgi:hypothetical protein
VAYELAVNGYAKSQPNKESRAMKEKVYEFDEWPPK